MDHLPFVYDISTPQGVPDRYDMRIERTLSTMRGQYLNHAAYDAQLAVADTLLYEVYVLLPALGSGDLMHGTSILHAGMVGDEYFMTKGHFHAEIETAEVYQCLAGEGVMVMETPAGEWAVAELRPGKVLYVPPLWAHRSVNTGRSSDLIQFYVCPARAGHDYGSIEKQGFRKLVVARDGKPAIVDNPRWLPPEKR